MIILALTLTLNLTGYINSPSISKTVYYDLDKCQRVAENFLYWPSVDVSRLLGVESVTSTAKCEMVEK